MRVMRFFYRALLSGPAAPPIPPSATRPHRNPGIKRLSLKDPGRRGRSRADLSPAEAAIVFLGRRQIDGAKARNGSGVEVENAPGRPRETLETRWDRNRRRGAAVGLNLASSLLADTRDEIRGARGKANRLLLPIPTSYLVSRPCFYRGVAPRVACRKFSVAHCESSVIPRRCPPFCGFAPGSRAQAICGLLPGTAAKTQMAARRARPRAQAPSRRRAHCPRAYRR